MNDQAYFTINCKECLFDSTVTTINAEGVCQMCELHYQQRESANSFDWVFKLNEIREKGEGKQYDCLIGISGGEDSSVLVYLAVKVWKLRPLVIHFNNRSNRPEADHNIKLLTKRLGVNFIEYYVDQFEYDMLTDAFLFAGTPDADIPNDVAMAKLMDTAAKQYGIKFILNGHSYREEGSSPKSWSLIDSTYLKSVYKAYTGKELKNYPLLSVWDQIYAGIIGIRQVRPFHYSDHYRPSILIELKKWGWKDYGGKHNENIYTAFVGNYLLPLKFNIDKRRTYLSAQMREGKISRREAELILSNPAEFNVNDLGERRDHILDLMKKSGIRDRKSFKSTNFKLYRPLFWVLMKLGVFPKSAFVKYCL